MQPEQPTAPTVLRFRSASGRTEIALRPDGTYSLHVLHGADILSGEEAGKAAWALSRVETVDLQTKLANDLLPVVVDMEAFGIPTDVNALDALRVALAQLRAAAAAYQRGLTEGRRQAAEGWEREWGVALRGHAASCVLSERDARGIAAGCPDDLKAEVFSRLVGPWEPAEPAGGAA